MSTKPTLISGIRSQNGIFRGYNRHFQTLRPIPEEDDPQRFADSLAGEAAVDIIDTVHSFAAEDNDDIPFFKPCPVGWTILGHVHHLHSGSMVELEIPDDAYRQGYGLPGDAEKTAEDLAFP
jgi:hypothetical protein